MSGISAKLNAIYDRIPPVACKGLCYESCGPIAMSADEFRLLEAATGQRPAFTKDWTCIFLNAEHRCTVYRRRPAICRLYGVAEGLRCEHGCEPARALTRAEAAAILAAVNDLSQGQIAVAEGPVL